MINLTNKQHIKKQKERDNILNQKAKLQRKYKFLLKENEKGRLHATNDVLSGFQKALSTIYSEEEVQLICSGETKFAELVDSLEVLKTVEIDEDYEILLRNIKSDLEDLNLEDAEQLIKEACKTVKYAK
jgi:hypothetical protein